MRDLVLLDCGQNPTGICRAHEDVGAAIGQQREGTDARRMRHRRHHEMDRRRRDRHAGPEDRVHRLDIAIGDLHTLGPACRAARTRQEGDVIRSLRQIRRHWLLSRQPCLERRLVNADELVDLLTGLANARQVGLEARMVEQHLHIGIVQDVEVLLQRIARIHRRPGDASAHDPQQARIGCSVIGTVDCRLRPAAEPQRQQPVGDAMRLLAHLGIGPSARAVVQAMPVGIEGSATVEIIDQPHGISSAERR